ncbi:MAG: hypothetical protein SF066_18015 [Thermoanaerobaculia bacterium]|nr:hypothetical protein [Thermoanaerobaculia bacterium]
MAILIVLGLLLATIAGYGWAEYARDRQSKLTRTVSAYLLPIPSLFIAYLGSSFLALASVNGGSGIAGVMAFVSFTFVISGVTRFTLGRRSVLTFLVLTLSLFGLSFATLLLLGEAMSRPLARGPGPGVIAVLKTELFSESSRKAASVGLCCVPLGTLLGMAAGAALDRRRKP